jgi:hypothetical protein
VFGLNHEMTQFSFVINRENSVAVGIELPRDVVALVIGKGDNFKINQPRSSCHS